MEEQSITELPDLRSRSPSKVPRAIGQQHVSTARQPASPNANCCTILRDPRRTRCSELQACNDEPVGEWPGPQSSDAVLEVYRPRKVPLTVISLCGLT